MMAAATARRSDDNIKIRLQLSESEKPLDLLLNRFRDEMEIMRLVGAPEHVVRLPLLLQGMMQGLLGAMLAIWLLVGCYAILGPRVEPLVRETLGLARLTFLRPHNVAFLMLAGTLLGGVGGILARGRAEP